MTDAASGHTSTGEVKDLTGIAYRLPALKISVVLERCSLDMSVGIAGCHVVRVQHVRLVDQLLVHSSLNGKLVKKTGKDLPPRLLSQSKVQCPDCLLRRLVTGEACPLVSCRGSRLPCLLQIAFGLSKPITRSIHHVHHRRHSRTSAACPARSLQHAAPEGRAD